MITDLEHIGNIPVSTATLASLFPKLEAGNQKVRQLEAAGKIIRLKKGLYVARPQGLARGSIYRIDSQPTLHPFIRLHADGLALLRTDTRSGLYHTVHDTEAHASFRHARGTIRVPKGGSRGFPDRHHKHQQAELRFSDGHRPEKALCDLIAHSAQALSSLSQGRRDLSGGRPTHGYRRLPTHGRQHL